MPTAAVNLANRRQEAKDKMDPDVLELQRRARRFVRRKMQNRAIPAVHLQEAFCEGSTEGVVGFSLPDKEDGDEEEEAKPEEPEAPKIPRLHPMQRELLRDALKHKMNGGPRGTDMAELFDRIDEDKSGSLDPDELVLAVRAVFEVSASVSPDSQIKALFAELDADGGGEISPQEILDFVTAAQQMPKRGYRQMIRPQLETILDTCDMLNEVAQYTKGQEQETEGEGHASSGLLEDASGPHFESAAVLVDSSGKVINAAKIRAEREAKLAALTKSHQQKEKKELKVSNMQHRAGLGGFVPKPPTSSKPSPFKKHDKRFGDKRGITGFGAPAASRLESYKRREEAEAVKMIALKAANAEERERLIQQRQVARLQKDPESLTQMLRQVVRTAF